MPRMGRLHVDGGCYHVIGRGLERRRIFATTGDKADFLERLEHGLLRTEISCLAWAMMPNHYHLLLQVNTLPLSTLMQSLLGGYASHYNRRHNRTGYVYQNRFKSILCQEETYLLALVRYIHLNPIKAGLLTSVSQLNNYPWTGHSVLIGNIKNNWQQTHPVLGRFSSNKREAREKYREYIGEDLSSTEDDFSGGGLIRSYGGWELVKSMRREHVLRVGDERILGDSDFVGSMLSLDEISLETRTRHQYQAWNLKKIVYATCDYFGLPPTEITNKGRNNDLARARSVIAYLASAECGCRVSEIADCLKITSSAVSKLKGLGRAYCASHDLRLENLNS